MDSNHRNDFFDKSLTYLKACVFKILYILKSIHFFQQKRKPLKIVEISSFSSIPGESEFIIQIKNKNIIMKLTAAKIINEEYDMNDFSEFHASIILHAARGTLVSFLKITDQNEMKYKVVSKKFNRESNQAIFTIEDNLNNYYKFTADDLARDKKLLERMSLDDICDIVYTNGAESILKEKLAIMLAKNN